MNSVATEIIASLFSKSLSHSSHLVCVDLGDEDISADAAEWLVWSQNSVLALGSRDKLCSHLLL